MSLIHFHLRITRSYRVIAAAIQFQSRCMQVFVVRRFSDWYSYDLIMHKREQRGHHARTGQCALLVTKHYFVSTCFWAPMIHRHTARKAYKKTTSSIGDLLVAFMQWLPEPGNASDPRRRIQCLYCNIALPPPRFFFFYEPLWMHASTIVCNIYSMEIVEPNHEVLS